MLQSEKNILQYLALQRKDCSFDNDEMAYQNHCWTWYTQEGTHDKCSEG